MRLNRTGKAAVLDKPKGNFEIKKYPVPDPAPATLVLRIELSGVCGTDIHIYHGYLSGIPFPLILGHEITGKIIALGKGVENDFLGKPVGIGDRIVLLPAIHCGKCYFCIVAKTPTKCPNAVQYGFFPNPDKKPYFTGGYAEYLYLHNPNTVFFKTSAPAEVAVFIEPSAMAVHAVDRAQIKVGDTVVVQGSGTLGLLTLVYAKLAGAAQTIVIGKRRKERLKIARELGADLTINMEEIPDKEERIRIIKERSYTGYGADVVFECSGALPAVSEGLQYLRDSATFCEVGTFVDMGSVDINPALDIVGKNITIEGVYDNGTEQFVKALPILEKGEIPFFKMISHKLPLERLKEAMTEREIDNKEITKIVVAPSSGEDS